MGAIIHDTSVDNRIDYLLILGDILDDLDNSSPVLICINLTQNTWQEIQIKGSERISGGRARGSMIVTGKIGYPNLRLSVFGGIKNEVRPKFYVQEYPIE